MDLVGYKLRNVATGEIVTSWGGIQGQSPAVPAVIYLPNGDQVCGATPGGEYVGFALDEWFMEPPPPPPLSFSNWLALFTSDEQDWAFASDNPQVRKLITLGAANGVIDLASPTVAAFLDLCIALGSPLTVERKAQVLAGTPPA